MRCFAIPQHKKENVKMSKICCFAGHSELYGEDGLYEKLLSVTEELILTEGITVFWAGNYGDFDRLCAKAVKALKEKYPEIKLELVVPYVTADIREYPDQYKCIYDNILIAEIPEKTPKRLGIIKANQYMVKKSCVLVCFVKRQFGGAAKTLEFAQKNSGMKIINLGIPE